ncbi:hypothetical protein [Bacillus sp. JJ722]|uniref:hypothetical protein n=1 Tax=Bacillus sp. JJ722 TaxID=3122973 RepID=UPI003000ABF4
MKEENTTNRPKTYQLDTFLELHGRGMSVEDICLMYKGMIEEDYHLTIDEIVEYLQCSDRYVRNEILPFVKHIRINQVARNMLLKYAVEHDEPNPLYMKRILFSLSSFHEFFLNNTTYSRAYIRFNMTDFEFEEIKELMTIIKESNEKNKEKLTLSEEIQWTIDSFKSKDFENRPVKSKLTTMPKKLLSAKDIKAEKGIRYDIIFYQYAANTGLNKVEYGSNKNGDPIFVRYIKKEMDEKFLVKMEISLFEQLHDSFGDDLNSHLIKKTKRMLLKS